ncbi:MAG TPA: NADH-quinone oxidoreductase subunit C [Thermodesulfovibrio thiophilus]|uniref:NADH-quinone oxidoreductase subunit C n=1 Tax=Thermodesulfovibrio thiophilus TaxID=340095 RepID=UPI0003FA800C|nr:NADH-quinone oxidoreductase subunit C [Thermodesulfovibrio thiophilus]HOA82385.1 NADH-quinone oxidoreductase subunit C [Thermodesulfovibrio thiophilus]HQA03643.1 NADH-quinone oxidoreductase subunit C [Thermodesulfovibrio thiophilus]HQD35812.1 NADH-quinone oxidoreductase subunit C [Thermodesulfovibrio thiophilus]
MAQKIEIKRALKIAEKVKELFSDEVLEINLFRGQLSLVVRKIRIKEILKFLKNECRFNHLRDLCGVDFFPEKPRFEVVYNLYSIYEKIHIRIKTRVDEEESEIDSITELWETANWHERECFDMFGIKFKGHPDLRRILMPEDWEGYPLRKDYPLKGQQLWRGFKEILETKNE